MVWITLFFAWREITSEQEQFSGENSLSSACESSLQNGTCSSRLSVYKPKTAEHRNKLNEIQNFPGQKEKDFTKMKKVALEKFFRKAAQEGATQGLLAVR